MEPGEKLDLSALEQAVRADIDRERGVVAWLRSRSPVLRLFIALSFAALVAVLTLLTSVRSDLHAYPLGRMLLVLGWFGVAAGAAAWLALRPIYLPRPSGRLVGAVVAFALLGPVVTGLLPEVPTAETYHAGYRTWSWAYGCFAAGTVAGIAALLFARALDRGGTHATGQLALAAVAAGLVGNVALQLHCPVNYAEHLLLGHATVPLGLLIGTLVGRFTRASLPAR